ncbi:hypothetical protein L917_04684, partial [Phytophthora nicotianae]
MLRYLVRGNGLLLSGTRPVPSGVKVHVSWLRPLWCSFANVVPGATVFTESITSTYKVGDVSGNVMFIRLWQRYG